VATYRFYLLDSQGRIIGPAQIADCEPEGVRPMALSLLAASQGAAAAEAWEWEKRVCRVERGTPGA
jgi:hypothetical protein